MKDPRSLTGPLLAAILASFLWIGCYTQFAVTHDEAATSDNAETAVVTEPVPMPVIVETIVILPPALPVWPAPVAGTYAPGATYQPPAQSSHRDVGSQRTPSASQSGSDRAGSSSSGSAGNSSASASSGGRTTGSSRGGR